MSKQWSTQQKKIFSWTKTGKGNLVVIARAGTGKTTTILEAVQTYAPERQILLAAFNKQIATELQSRIKKDYIQAKTLHSLGYQYIRKAWGNVTLDTDGVREITLARAACDPDSSSDVIRLVATVHTKTRELSPRNSSPEDILEIMTRYDLLPEEGMEMEEGATALWIARRASKAVDLAKKRSATIDFADMIFLPLALGIIRPWFTLVVIDEAQDMTLPQLEIARQACTKDGRIIVVGDDRQAIYGFRGADSDSLNRLQTVLKATVLPLNTTYRCPKRIVELASEIVPDFQAAPEAPEGIIEHCTDLRLLAVAGPNDFILSRTNAPLVRICLSLLRQGKKAVIRGRDIGKGLATLVDRQKARDLTSLAKKLAGWKERETKRAKASLEASAAQTKIDYLADSVSVIGSLSEDVKTVAELKSKMYQLFSDDSVGAIVCSSTHKAKGLESNNVYLLEGTFKGRNSGSSEEKNILYVAITRSKQRLVWVSGFEN